MSVRKKEVEAVSLWRGVRENLGLGERGAQEELFEGVSAALGRGEVVFADAPCGAGKSLLTVPLSAFRAPQSGRVIYSAFTKAQQAQMYAGGLELVECGVFADVVEVRGRSEYVCNRRRAEAGLDVVVLESGLRSEFVDAVDDEEWELSRSDSDEGCSHKTCGGRDYANRARGRALQPGALVVVNHSLLILNEITNGGVFGDVEDDCLLLDEAHQAPGAFRSALGFTLSVQRITRMANKALEAGVDVEGHVGATLLNAWFSRFSRDMQRKRNGDSFIYVEVFPAELLALKVWAERAEDLLEPVFARAIQDLKDAEDSGRREAQAVYAPISAAAGMCANLRRELWLLKLALEEGTGGSWGDVGGRWPVMEYRPLDVSGDSSRLINGYRSAVAASATIKHAVGELGGGTLVQVSSPFDLAKRRVAIVSGNGRGRKEVDDVQRMDELVRCVRRAEGRGGVLVLAPTNKVDGKSVMDWCAERLGAEGFRVDVQRSPGDVPRLVEGLRSRSLDVVVGTASMREGVDLKGDALVMVVLWALSWPYMGDPVLKAQMARAGERRKWDVIKPIMLANTEQAIGRLLRDQGDAGYVVLLDGRASAVQTFRELVEPSAVKILA